MVHWHYMMLELILADRRVRPWISPETDLTRQQARAEIESLLRKTPGGQVLADRWASGATEDTIHLGPFTFTIFECGRDCASSAQAVLDNYLATLAVAGLEVRVAKPRR